jgi:membrane protein implicated in regulation of membrane protease activity
MNRAFYIIGIPAVITSFLWLAFGWGWRVAAVVTGAELVVAILGVIYLLRRQSARQGGSQAGR